MGLVRCSTVGLLLLVAGCTDLSRLPAGECGNTVVETGEDCDVHVDPALGERVECAQCRYVCSAGAECPTGWGCGPDGICVHGAERLEEAPGAPFALPGDRWLLGDLDGDGRGDLVTELGSGVEVHFGSAGASLVDGPDWRSAIPFTARPVVADVDRDGADDLVVSTARGLDVLRGAGDRTLSPVAYSPYALPGYAFARLVPLRAALRAADSLLLLGTTDEGDLVGTILTVPAGAAADPVPLGLPPSFEDLAERVAVGDLDGDDLDEVVLTQRGGTSVHFLGTTGATGRPLIVRRGILVLPEPETATGDVFLVDHDGDGDLDVLLPLVGDSVVVAANDGAGHFADVANAFRVDAGARVLAVGDASGDGQAEVVRSDGVHRLTPSGLVRAAPRPAEPYSAALVADLDRDGDDEIVAAVDATTGTPGAVHVLIAAPGGGYTDLAYVTGGSPFDLRASDLDGFGSVDLVFGVRGAGTDELFALFEPTSRVSAPTLIARTAPLEHIEAARFGGYDGLFDGAGDLVVSGAPTPTPRGDVRPVSFFVGSPWRHISAPLGLRRPESDVLDTVDTPRAVAFGRFLDGGGPLACLALADAALMQQMLWVIPGAAGAAYDMERARSTTSTLAAPSLWITGDVDGDRLDEVVSLAVRDSTLTAAILRPATPPSVEPLALEGLGTPRHGRIVDVDRDGRIDLLVTFDGGAALYRGGEAGLATRPLVLEADDAAVVDLDADAPRELVLLRDGELRFADLTATSLEPRLGVIAVPGARQVQGGDIDGDGLDDVLTGDGTNVWVHRVVPHTEP